LVRPDRPDTSTLSSSSHRRQEYAFLHLEKAFSLLKKNLKPSLSYDSSQASTVIIKPSLKLAGYDAPHPLQEDGKPAKMAGLHHPTFFVYNRPFTISYTSMIGN
jgi:hypothetical protein